MSEGVDPSHWQRVGTGVHVLGAKGDRPLAACRCLYPMRYKVDRCFAMTAAAQPRGGRVTGSVSVPVPHAVQGRSLRCDDRREGRNSKRKRAKEIVFPVERSIPRGVHGRPRNGEEEETPLTCLGC